MNNDQLFIIPANNKPIKFVFEDDPEITFTEVPNSEKEALQYTIRNMWASKKITGQQYKTEKGKIRKDNFKEVVNFITKRNMYDFYIDDLNTAKTIFNYTFSLPTEYIKENKFGIIKF